ncbi:MAG: nucleotidyltransferase family protein [Alphaproteobacteria bacterium]
MSVTPNKAMVLAAGRGTRMRDISKETPKPLVQVNNKALIDYALNRITETGLDSCVVNICHLGSMIREYITKRSAPEIIFSEEEEPLDTGGGVKKALPLLGAAPFWVTNSDPIWTEEDEKPALLKLAEHFDSEKYDAVILLQPIERCFGHDGVGDYFMEDGVPRRKFKEENSAPLVYAGAQILNPNVFKNITDTKFSLVKIYDEAEKRKRLGAVVHKGDWFHVGTPEALAMAQKRLG